MKNLLKISVISSFMIIACLLISACGGGDSERAIRNDGDVRITVKDSSNLPLLGVKVEVRKDAGSGTLTNLGNTDASGRLTYTDTADRVYYFTLSKTGYETQTDIASPKLLWSETVEINVTLVKL